MRAFVVSITKKQNVFFRNKLESLKLKRNTNIQPDDAYNLTGSTTYSKQRLNFIMQLRGKTPNFLPFKNKFLPMRI